MNPDDLMLPPQAIEAEQSLLGCLLMGGDAAFDAVATMLTDSDFYRDDNRRIWRHIRTLSEQGKPVDVLTVDDAIRLANEKDQTGGLAYLGDLANGFVSVARIRSYAELVRDKARRRRLMAAAEEMIGMAMGADTAVQAVDAAQALLMDIEAGHKASKGPRHIAEVMGCVVGALQERFEKGDAIAGLPTGFADVDQKTTGLYPGDLIIVAGRPAMGKTAWAMNVAENVAIAGKTVLVFSLEMSDMQLATRSLVSVGGADMQAVRTGQLKDDDWDALTVSMSKLHNSKLFIDEAAGAKAGGMLATARQIKRQHGLDLVVIDYLQLMTGNGTNRTEQVGEISRQLKLMAKTLQCPVICLSQLSRKVEERADKRPLMSDLRDSGSIEQDADAILMLYRDDYYNPESPWRGHAELGLVKNRMGETGTVHLVFQPRHSRFRSADPQEVARISSESQAQPKPFKRACSAI